MKNIVFQDMKLCSVVEVLFFPEDGGNILLRNVSKLQPDYATSHLRKQWSLQSQNLKSRT
jgi:hypothetical protein